MRRIKTAIVGLGRLGMYHAEDIMFRLPNAELVAACSVAPAELDRVGDWGVKCFADFDEMLKLDEIEAVVIASSSGAHTAHIEAALEAGKHVFCEKPLGLTVEECVRAKAVVDAHPKQAFMLGFMRRFDPSYAAAKRKIQNGEIGRPIIVKATSLDPISAIAGFLKFAPTSGGEFLDMAVHDIDLCSWYLEDEVESIYAIGDAYLYPEVKQYGDGDNVCALMRYKNGQMAFLHAGRTAPNGYQVETEITGTKNTIRVSAIPRVDRLEIYNNDGVLTECAQSFIERFGDAYRLEKQEFFNCVIENRPCPCGADDGLRATRIAFAATEAFQTGKIVTL